MTIFPFRPRTTSELAEGQFWGVRLNDGRFVCGRVLQVSGDQLPTPRVSFFGGLLNWIGDEPPDFASIAGAGVLEWGAMHLRAITRIGTGILGARPLDLDGIQVPILLSAMAGTGCLLLRGAQSIRVAGRSEWGKWPVLGFWGYDYIKDLAEHRLGRTASVQ